MSHPDDEILDWVDSNDNIVGQASRKEVHEKSLLHRSVHIFVFNRKGDLYLQKRTLRKDENPGLWDSSAAGHITSGETYLASAHRELKEELGIAGELEEFFRISASEETLWEHVHAYKCVTHSSIIADPEEISEGGFWAISKIEGQIEKNSTRFTPVFIMIFRHFLFHLLQNE